MSISQAKKLTLFVMIGAAFGLLCLVLGAREQNYVLMGAGALALLGGLALTSTAMARRRTRR
jgi:DMSO/TMAO reductase YedYZ heme-binding membrane subunit